MNSPCQLLIFRKWTILTSSAIFSPSWRTLRSPSEKAMAPYCSTLAWKIPWMEEPGRLQTIWSLRVGNDWETSHSLFTFMPPRRKWQPTPVFLLGESQGRVTWWAAVSGVAQSRTWLKWLSSSSSNRHILWRKEYVLRICLINSCGVYTDSWNVSLGFCSRDPQIYPYSSVAYKATQWFPVASGPNELSTCHLKQEISMVLWKELCSEREGIWPLSIPYTYLCGSTRIMLI